MSECVVGKDVMAGWLAGGLAGWFQPRWRLDVRQRAVGWMDG